MYSRISIKLQCFTHAKALRFYADSTIKWVRDFYYGCKEGMENGFAEGAKLFAIESAVTISVPIVAIVFGFVGPLFR